MIKSRKKMVRWAVSMAIAAALVITAAAPAFAQEPTGPASDPQIAAQKDEATGPAAAAQTEGQGEAQNQTGGQTAQEPALPAEEPPQGETAQEGEQPPEQIAGEPPSTDGLVMSGGRYINPAKPMIALTFDDGPYAPVGNRILDSLEQNNGRATFFVVGNRVAAYQTEVRRIHDNGHEVANHTYEHKYLTKLGAGEIRSQIERCNQAVASVTGARPSLVRLPGGLKNGTVLANVDYPIIMWSIDTLDWKTRNAQKTVAAVMGKVKDGDVILMHELYTASADAAEVLIPALAEQGYQLVTVSELAQFRGGVGAGGIYNKFRP